MATSSNTPPPNDINKLGQAWTLLQSAVNVTLPIVAARLAVAKSRLHK